MGILNTGMLIGELGFIIVLLYTVWVLLYSSYKLCGVFVFPPINYIGIPHIPIL